MTQIVLPPTLASCVPVYSLHECSGYWENGRLSQVSSFVRMDFRNIPEVVRSPKQQIRLRYDFELCCPGRQPKCLGPILAEYVIAALSKTMPNYCMTTARWISDQECILHLQCAVLAPTTILSMREHFVLYISTTTKDGAEEHLCGSIVLRMRTNTEMQLYPLSSKHAVFRQQDVGILK